jgi:hypothetical protein
MSAFPHAAGLYPRFRSKIDIWLGGGILLGTLVSGAVALGLLFQKGSAAFAIVPLMATGLSLWLLIDTWYCVTDTELIVHCGPFRSSVLISSIRAVRPTRTVLSAPALSLDRLEVTHAGGALIISPADKAGFIRALKERRGGVEVPHVEAPSIVGRRERLLKWTLPIVPVVVLSVAGATMISGSNPLRVGVTPDAVTVHGSWGTSVPLTDIASVSLVDTLPHLRRTMGYGGWGTMRARPTSRELGERGYAYVTRNAPPFVVATTRRGFLVFNSDDPRHTRQLFEELQSKVGAIRKQRTGEGRGTR